MFMSLDARGSYHPPVLQAGHMKTYTSVFACVVLTLYLYLSSTVRVYDFLLPRTRLTALGGLVRSAEVERRCPLVGRVLGSSKSIS